MIISYYSRPGFVRLAETGLAQSSLNYIDILKSHENNLTKAGVASPRPHGSHNLNAQSFRLR